MHMKSTLDVLTYGEAMALFAATETGPLEKVERFSKRIAGAELNVATGLARLGFKVGWISRVGHDAFGQFVLDTLEREGIDATHVTRDTRYPTGFMLKQKSDDGSDPGIEYFRKGSAASHLSLSDYCADYVLASRHLHLTGVAAAISPSSRELAFHLARQMRSGGRTITFDPNLRERLWSSRQTMIDTLNSLAALSNWVLPGIDEGRILSGCETPADIAKFYMDRGAQGVVVKLGAGGAYFCMHGQSGVVAAQRVEHVVDTVGAGDGFAVGFISALLCGHTIANAVGRGNRIGALAIQAIGDSEGVPPRIELDLLEGVPDSR
jgi:2-dehydro-3-deoxygluconokinase